MLSILISVVIALIVLGVIWWAMYVIVQLLGAVGIGIVDLHGLR